MSTRLTSDEAWDVLERSHTGILTTLRADGTPVTLPTWFVALDRTICFATRAPTKKVARLRRDPRASFLVESGEHWLELRAVHLSGHIEPVDDEGAKARIDKAIDDKYAAFVNGTRGYDACRSFFRLVPGPRVLTWDNSRRSIKEPTSP